MAASEFLIIRIGKHKERVRTSDFLRKTWPKGVEILEGTLPKTGAQGADGTSGASTPNEAETPASGDESADMETLKAKADALGVTYAANIGFKTLYERVAAAQVAPE